MRGHITVGHLILQNKQLYNHVHEGAPKWHDRRLLIGSGGSVGRTTRRVRRQEAALRV